MSYVFYLIFYEIKFILKVKFKENCILFWLNSFSKLNYIYKFFLIWMFLLFYYNFVEVLRLDGI